ncbi:DUF4214 domain-containing protein [Paenibacillus hodogayensis]|uniref:DUF4214 domain-containing protein n=1 Tax=Paenibacillus hodogayensis TaxID=279208 RepID=A0ABV5VSZ9_9BACL
MNIAHKLHRLLQLNNEAFIGELYRSLLDREPDPGGAAGHAHQLRTGTSKYRIMTGFLLSDEALALYSRRQPVSGGEHVCGDLQRLFAKKDDSFVGDLFRYILLRAPDTASYGNYIGMLRSGQSRASLFAGFVLSDEFQQLITLDKYAFARRSLDQLILSFYN